MATKEDDVIKGFDCECGEHHTYPPYVFAHYDEPLLHTCEKCGRRHTILQGRARLVKGNTLADVAREG